MQNLLLVPSEAVKKAMTTSGATNEEPQYGGDYKNMAQQGDALLRQIILAFLNEKGITNRGTIAAIVAETIASKNLAKVFDSIADAANIQIRMSKQEKSKGLSEKTKAGILEALLFATHEDGQGPAFDYIFDEIKKTISLDTSASTRIANPVNEVQEIIQGAGHGHIGSYLSDKRVGGTDGAPVWEFSLSYDDISVSEQGKNKKEVKKATCQKWLDENEKRPK